MTTHHRDITGAPWVVAAATRALGPCSCDAAWTERGLCSENCALCQHGQDVVDSLIHADAVNGCERAVVDAAVAERVHRHRFGYELTKLENDRIVAVDALIAARKEASRG